MKEQIIEVLKQFEQKDYKTGGVSLAPEMYNAVAESIVKLLPDVSNSVCSCGSFRYGYGFAKCFDCGKIKDV